MACGLIVNLLELPVQRSACGLMVVVPCRSIMLEAAVAPDAGSLPTVAELHFSEVTERDVPAVARALGPAPLPPLPGPAAPKLAELGSMQMRFLAFKWETRPELWTQSWSGLPKALNSGVALKSYRGPYDNARYLP